MVCELDGRRQSASAPRARGPSVRCHCAFAEAPDLGLLYAEFGPNLELVGRLRACNGDSLGHVLARQGGGPCLQMWLSMSAAYAPSSTSMAPSRSERCGEMRGRPGPRRWACSMWSKLSTIRRRWCCCWPLLASWFFDSGITSSGPLLLGDSAVRASPPRNPKAVGGPLLSPSGRREAFDAPALVYPDRKVGSCSCVAGAAGPARKQSQAGPTILRTATPSFLFVPKFIGMPL